VELQDKRAEVKPLKASPLMRKDIVEQDDQWLPACGRPTYTKAKRSHLSEDTLNFHQLPWEIDAVCHDRSTFVPEIS
jgi:hypothetical protein